MLWYINLWRILKIWFIKNKVKIIIGINGCGNAPIGISYMITFMKFFAMMILSLFIAVIL